MLHLFSTGVKYLKKHGLLITIVAIFKWISYKINMEYYRRNVIETSNKVGDNLSVNGSTSVSGEVYLGDNVNFNGLKIHGWGKLTIGDNFYSGSDCKIITRNHNYDDGDAIPFDDTYDHKQVTIGDNVWLGTRVTIVPGVTINEGAIIQAGSTVTSDIPKGAIAGGHPAEVFSQRDMDHYEKLKSEGKFRS